MKLEKAHKAVLALKRSDGWQYLTEVMRREIDTATRQLSDPKQALPDQTIHVFRGAIWAAHQLLALPDRVLMELENELLIEEAKKKLAPKDDPAKPNEP